MWRGTWSRREKEKEEVRPQGDQSNSVPHPCSRLRLPHKYHWWSHLIQPPTPPHLGGHSFDVGRNNTFKSVGVLLPGVDDGLCLLLPEELVSGDNVCRQRASPEGSTNLPFLGSTELYLDPLRAMFK